VYGYGIQVNFLPSSPPNFHGHEPAPCGSASSTTLGSTSASENPSEAVLAASTTAAADPTSVASLPPPRPNIRPILDAPPLPPTLPSRSRSAFGSFASALGVTLLASAARAANAHTTTAHVATVVRRRPSPRRPSSLLPSFPVILRNLATAPFFKPFDRSIDPTRATRKRKRIHPSSGVRLHTERSLARGDDVGARRLTGRRCARSLRPFVRPSVRSRFARRRVSSRRPLPLSFRPTEGDDGNRC